MKCYVTTCAIYRSCCGCVACYGINMDDVAKRADDGSGCGGDDVQGGMELRSQCRECGSCTMVSGKPRPHAVGHLGALVKHSGFVIDLSRVAATNTMDGGSWSI